MGNEDIVIIINEDAFIVKGENYNDREDAIKMALLEYKLYSVDLAGKADNKYEILQEPYEIRIYKLICEAKKE